MKFEKDFDFESANAQFNKEEIDREFHNKLKLKGGFLFFYSGNTLIWLVNYGYLVQVLTFMVCVCLSLEDKLEKQEKPVNGEDKGDSGVDTQNSEGNADEEDPLGPNCYYDKTKSFFDNISCDDNRYSLLSCSYALRRLKYEMMSYKFTQFFGFFFNSQSLMNTLKYI